MPTTIAADVDCRKPTKSHPPFRALASPAPGTTPAYSLVVAIAMTAVRTPCTQRGRQGGGPRDGPEGSPPEFFSALEGPVRDLGHTRLNLGGRRAAGRRGRRR